MKFSTVSSLKAHLFFQLNFQFLSQTVSQLLPTQIVSIGELVNLCFLCRPDVNSLQIHISLLPSFCPSRAKSCGRNERQVHIAEQVRCMQSVNSSHSVKYLVTTRSACQFRQNMVLFNSYLLYFGILQDYNSSVQFIQYKCNCNIFYEIMASVVKDTCYLSQLFLATLFLTTCD